MATKPNGNCPVSSASDSPVTSKKKGRENKQSITNGIKEAVDKYNAFNSLDTMKVVPRLEQSYAVCYWRSASDEIPPAIFNASKLFRGDAGLLITDMRKEEIAKLI